MWNAFILARSKAEKKKLKYECDIFWDRPADCWLGLCQTVEQTHTVTTAHKNNPPTPPTLHPDSSQ